MRLFSLNERAPAKHLPSDGLHARALVEAEGHRLPLLVKRPLHPALDAAEPFHRAWLGGAEASAKLETPACVRVVDWGMRDGAPHLASEYPVGCTLREILERVEALGERLDQGVALSIAATLLQVLAHASEQIPLFTNLDLGPESLRVTPEGALLVPEFGLWSALDPAALVRLRFHCGHVHYLAPEVLKSTPSEPRSDLFSVGVLLCELVTGRSPFLRPTALMSALAITQRTELTLPGLENVDASLRKVIEDLAAPSVDTRLPTAEAALRALEPHLVAPDEARAALSRWATRTMATSDAPPSSDTPESVPRAAPKLPPFPPQLIASSSQPPQAAPASSSSPPPTVQMPVHRQAALLSMSDEPTYRGPLVRPAPSRDSASARPARAPLPPPPVSASAVPASIPVPVPPPSSPPQPERASRASAPEPPPLLSSIPAAAQAPRPELAPPRARDGLTAVIDRMTEPSPVLARVASGTAEHEPRFVEPSSLPKPLPPPAPVAVLHASSSAPPLLAPGHLPAFPSAPAPLPAPIPMRLDHERGPQSPLAPYPIPSASAPKWRDPSATLFQAKAHRIESRPPATARRPSWQLLLTTMLAGFLLVLGGLLLYRVIS